jgi:hypothetical protein
VSLPIITNDKCNDYMGGILPTKLCAGPDQGLMDSCYGDSGGPLMIFENNTWKLAGIVSSGNGCALPDNYGIYTRVSEFIGFIGTYVPTYPLAGDLTLDGKVGVEDAIGDLQTVAGLRSPISASPVPGDLNADSHIGLDDVVGILQILTARP